MMSTFSLPVSFVLHHAAWRNSKNTRVWYLCTFPQGLILASWWESQDAARMGVELRSARFVITIGKHDAGSVTRRRDDYKVSFRA